MTLKKVLTVLSFSMTKKFLCRLIIIRNDESKGQAVGIHPFNQLNTRRNIIQMSFGIQIDQRRRGNGVTVCGEELRVWRVQMLLR